jgi:hypothetical protein
MRKKLKNSQYSETAGNQVNIGWGFKKPIRNIMLVIGDPGGI